MGNRISLMIHGGAGDFSGVSATQRNRYLQTIRRTLISGYERLCGGSSAIETVEHCVVRLEDDPMFNAGRGSVLNEFGMVEMDAGIMDGLQLAAGAVAAVGQTRNPIRVARRIMQEGHHVLLVGEGAERYARTKGISLEEEAYFVTERRIRQLRDAQQRGKVHLDHEAEGSGIYSTVGAVARDASGNLAAATSTGGMTNKRWSRVGDTPLIGAGVYADNARCAVSATGVGEHIMRFVLAKYIADSLNGPAETNAYKIDSALSEFKRRLGGQAGVIVIDQAGQTFARCTTQGMIHGWTDADGVPRCRIDCGDRGGASARSNTTVKP